MGEFDVTHLQAGFQQRQPVGQTWSTTIDAITEAWVSNSRLQPVCGMSMV